MVHNMLAGLPVTVLCLVLQGSFVAYGLRHYVRFRAVRERNHSLWLDIAALSSVMLLMLAASFLQMILWAGLFMLIGEFGDFATALYHSGVNFSTLGYGDIVMSQRWRLLGPIEAAQGILMFGVSTAVMTAAVNDVIKSHTARSSAGPQPG